MSNERDYLIWSHEHRGWWRPGNGYTPRLSEAGRFTRDRALKICAEAMPGQADRTGMLPELPVRLADLEAFIAPYVASDLHLLGGAWL